MQKDVEIVYVIYLLIFFGLLSDKKIVSKVYPKLNQDIYPSLEINEKHIKH